eukprot:scaffold13002_cov125-Isochrysis_galbana.AAC.2
MEDQCVAGQRTHPDDYDAQTSRSRCRHRPAGRRSAMRHGSARRNVRSTAQCRPAIVRVPSAARWRGELHITNV